MKFITGRGTVIFHETYFRGRLLQVEAIML